MIYGAMAGDINGSIYEFNNYKKKDFRLWPKDMLVTDDSIMTVAIARALMDWDKGGRKDKLDKLAIKRMKEYGRKYPYAGYGGAFRRWLVGVSDEPYWSWGNGSAMRVSPVAYFAKSLEECKELSGIVTGVTHDHPEGMKGAECTAVCIWLALHGYNKEYIRDYVYNNYYKIDFTIDEIRPTYKFDESCQGTVPQAVEAFLEGENFEDVVRTAISVGGDSDTLAAIACSIGEAYYGMSVTDKFSVFKYLNKYLRKDVMEANWWYERKCKCR